jgi:hypothetical protein
MATGTTTSANFTITPQVLLEAVREGIQGMHVLGATGIVAINSSLPNDKRTGETITVPFLAHIGEWAEYAENDPIAVTQMQDSAETSAVARSGKAFTMTDMARILRGYASPMEAGRSMLQDGLATWVERKALSAMVALGTARPSIVVDVHSATTPRYYDRDLHIAVRSRFGDELRGMAGTVTHSQVINRMLTLKDADGVPLHKLLEQDDDNGVYTFEGMGRFYSSDLVPVTYTVASAGTTPPVLTLTGSPKGMYDQIRVECTTLGAFGTAQIRISTDGGTTWVASGVVVPVSGVVDRSDDLGLVFTFASGTFAVNNVYTSRGKATSITAKRGAVVFWHNNFGGGPEDQRDVLRKNTIVAADVLGVVHAYKKMNGGTRPGIALGKFNI